MSETDSRGIQTGVEGRIRIAEHSQAAKDEPFCASHSRCAGRCHKLQGLSRNEKTSSNSNTQH